MRRLFRVEEATARGLTRSVFAGVSERDAGDGSSGAFTPRGLTNRTRSIDSCPGPRDRGRSAAAGRAVLHGLDGVTEPDDRPLRRGSLPDQRVVTIDGIRCADGFQTLVDLAADLDDLRWEQALESALRKRLTSIREIEAAFPELGVHGRRVCVAFDAY